VRKRSGRKPWQYHTPLGKRLRLYLLVNSAAYLGTLPLIGTTFHTVQTFAILANLPLVPLAGVLTQAGVAALGVFVLWPALAPWVFVPFIPLLTWTVTIAETVAHGRQRNSISPPLRCRCCSGTMDCWGVCSSGAVALASPMCRAVHHIGVDWCRLAISGDTYAATPRDVSGRGFRGRHCRTGPGIIPSSSTGRTYDGRFDTGMQLVAPFLWQHYVRRFDLMALTHMHPDHARAW